MPLVRRKEARTIMRKREVLGVRYDEIESIHRAACSQRKNARDDASIDNHSRSLKIVYMWIVGSAIGNLRPFLNLLLNNRSWIDDLNLSSFIVSFYIVLSAGWSAQLPI